MKYRVVNSILLATVFLSSFFVSTLAEEGEVKPVRTIDSVANPEVRYLTIGPSGSGFRLRLSILLSEVYYSVVVEEIFEDPDRENWPSVEAAHLLTGAALGRSLGFSVLYQLRFVRWHSPTEAELANNGLHFILTRAARGAFSVRSIEP